MPSRIHFLLPRWKSFLFLAVFLTFFETEEASAQFHERPRIFFRGGADQRFDFLGTSSKNDTPLSLLPEAVTVTPGEVTLVPDFSSPQNNRIPVHIVNASGHKFELEMTSVDLPIVLEAHLGDGHWERAEPLNLFVRLLSQKRIAIADKGFRLRKARYWGEGEKATLRYALYQDGAPVLTSESFEGLLPIGEIDQARHDFMSAALVPESLRIRFLPGETQTDEIEREWFLKLDLMRSFGPCHVDLSETQKWIASVHQSPVSTRREKEVAIRLQLELLKSRPITYQADQLRRRCQSVLFARDSHSQGLRGLCWRLAADLAREKSSQGDFEFDKLAKLAWNLLFSGESIEEKEAAADFLCVDFIAKNHSPILQFKNETETLLDHEVPHVRVVLANWILANQKNGREKIVLSFYRNNVGRIGERELVRVLHFDRLFNPYGRPDWTLWAAALDKNPAYTIPRLSVMFETDNRTSNLRKFSQSTVLPDEIRTRLLKFYDLAPAGEMKQSVKRLLDNVSGRPKPFSWERIQF